MRREGTEELTLQHFFCVFFVGFLGFGGEANILRSSIHQTNNITSAQGKSKTSIKYTLNSFFLKEENAQKDMYSIYADKRQQ